MIKLTLLDGRPIYINKDHIICIAPKRNEDAGSIVFMTNKTMEVVEKTDKIEFDIYKTENL